MRAIYGAEKASAHRGQRRPEARETDRQTETIGNSPVQLSFLQLVRHKHSFLIHLNFVIFFTGVASCSSQLVL